MKESLIIVFGLLFLFAVPFAHAQESIIVDTDGRANGRITFTASYAGKPFTFWFAHDIDAEGYNSNCNLRLADSANHTIHPREITPKNKQDVMKTHWINLNDYALIEGRILKLTVIGSGTSTSDKTKFEDVITGETFEFTTGTNNYSSSYIYGVRYYVKVESPGANPENVTLTWGNGSSPGYPGYILSYGYIKINGTEEKNMKKIGFSEYDFYSYDENNNEYVQHVVSATVYLGTINHVSYNINIPINCSGEIESIANIKEPQFNIADSFNLSSSENGINKYIGGGGIIVKYDQSLNGTNGNRITIVIPSETIVILSENKSNKNITESTNTSSKECSDTDGLDYFTAGITSNKTIEKSDVCIGEGVLEYYCSEMSVKSASYLCFNGCSEGKCIKEANETLHERVFNPTEETGPIEISLNISEEMEEIICSGCLSDNKCYPLGYRKSGKYCSENEEFVKQLSADESCDNNFECESNVCTGEECIGTSLIRRIINWLKNLFS